ncbi:MAG: arginine--tRNA ligase [Desulfobacterales bacterium]|nr:arginine--tRNA ligase [Desulfobacterales bacterium]
MKRKLKDLMDQAARAARENGDLPSPELPAAQIEEPKVETQGDYATNLALTMAGLQKMPPRSVAGALVKNILDPHKIIDRVEIAGPGFINFFIRPASWYPVLAEIHQKDAAYGACPMGRGEKVQVEFVSANPTGPLHVGHGRGAAVGDSIANLLSFCGYQVEKEYYINDSGRQIHTLGRSVFLRYQALFDRAVDFPADGYQGDYIRELAGQIRDEAADRLLSQKEADAVAYCARFAAGRILAGIRSDLADFGVQFHNWASEQALFDAGKVEAVIEDLRRRDIVYENDGALWFRTTGFGDEKDRVVVRGNGLTTYFASDIAYHCDKFQRGFERVIDVWGADHHGYIPRMTASIQATGRKKSQFQVILVQLVNLLRDQKPVAMSTRAGEFVTLSDVVREVGKDAARFIFLTRHYDSSLDFDLELAKKKTNDNPVYYVQYVHARISSLVRRGRDLGISPAAVDGQSVHRLDTSDDIRLIKMMSRYPEVIETSAQLLEPHRITFFLMDLAAGFHAYYNKQRVLTEDPELTGARMYLVLAVQKLIRNGLTLLGVSAPERM